MKIKKKKKKKKKKPIPANYDPNRNPDPERWLPKYERSTYKAKKTRSKAKNADVGKGTQGADTAASLQFDMSSKVKAQAPDSPSGDGPAVGSSGGFRKDHNKKKKKKR